MEPVDIRRFALVLVIQLRSLLYSLYSAVFQRFMEVPAFVRDVFWGWIDLVEVGLCKVLAALINQKMVKRRLLAGNVIFCWFA